MQSVTAATATSPTKHNLIDLLHVYPIPIVPSQHIMFDWAFEHPILASAGAIVVIILTSFTVTRALSANDFSYSSI